MVRGIYDASGRYLGRIWGSDDPQWRGWMGKAEGVDKTFGPMQNSATAESAVRLAAQNRVNAARNLVGLNRPGDVQLKLRLS